MSECIVDRVFFHMPVDRELQFAAMTVLQSYVNSYAAKMTANNPGQPGRYTFQLKYQTDLSKDDWDFFQALGLELKEQPVEFDRPDAVFDLSNERVQSFASSGKHVIQVYGAITGVGCLPLPVIDRIQPMLPTVKQPCVWWVLDPLLFSEELLDVACDDYVAVYVPRNLFPTKLQSISGIIDVASWATYLATAAGLPVVEILPPGRPRNWLSKFAAPLYRLVDPLLGDVPGQIREAVKNLEGALQCIAQAAECNKEPMPTAP